MPSLPHGRIRPGRLLSVTPDRRPSSSVAAFDLDGTLVRGSSFGQFVRLLIYRSPGRLIVAALGIPILAPLTPSRRMRRRIGSAFVWLATLGRSEDELRRRARTFANWHAGPASGNRIDIACSRLAAHLRAGHRVVVVTAAVDPVASEVVRALDIGRVDVLAARLRPVLGGWIPEGNRHGIGKVHRLQDSGHRLPVAHAYTDSAHDLPLLLSARHAYAVHPRPRHWRELRAAVPDCTILTTGGLR